MFAGRVASLRSVTLPTPSSPAGLLRQRLHARLQETHPLAAYRELIAENDALILGPDLDNGRAIVTARTEIHDELIAFWAEEQQRLFNYDRPFAVAALGGTGRCELTPCSDTDFAFLFDDAIEDNAFRQELTRQTLHSKEFVLRFGFDGGGQPFNLDDMPDLDGKQLNAFLDLRPIYDPTGLTDRFRERIRATFDPFEHFLHVSRLGREDGVERSLAECRRLDRFEIKSEGLRVFLSGIWTLGGQGFRHSHEVYASLEDPRDLGAYDFLLRIRAFVHLRRGTHQKPHADGTHEEDVLGFGDFVSFGEMLGADAGERERFELANEVRARLLAARRRVARFTRGVVGRELQRGHAIHPGSEIIYGVGGLRHTTSSQFTTEADKSRAALSLLLASQHYAVPIDPSELEATFRNAGDWLVPVPELADLFHERRGSLADSFEFLSQFPGAEERLFPGYSKFEVSMDDRVLTQRECLRGTLERQKMRVLERLAEEGALELASKPAGGDAGRKLPRELSPAVETALLDGDDLAAVKLALKTKRLPVTPVDALIQHNEALALHVRFSTGLSGIPLDRYYNAGLAGAEFSSDALDLTRFLVASRRAFKEWSDTGLNDPEQVRRFAELCGSEERLRALFVFTCADRAEWESDRDDPVRWFNTRELYLKTMHQFRPAVDPLRSLAAAGYSREELDVLRDFGQDFFGGVYRQYANRFCSYLVEMASDPARPGARLRVLREGTSVILGLAARDFQGLAACVSGAFWHHGIMVSQAHLFSAINHGLALDFFHLAPGSRVPGPELLKEIEESIRGRCYLTKDEGEDEAIAGSNLTLQEWRPGLYSLRAEAAGDVGRLIHALTRQVYGVLGGNVFGLKAHRGRSGSYVSVYHSLPSRLPLAEARELIHAGH